ncbi:MAG: hypothetical protein ACLU33_03400 [Christensenellales bacterium]
MYIKLKIPNNNKSEEHKMKIYAFVGPSGTGKSYRAQLVASTNDIHYIIDDGLFINENEVLAGTSAKKAPTKIETVKHALFLEKKEQDEMKKAFKKYKPDSLLVLGTSDKMVEKIRENLDLPPFEKTIYINDVATEEEMEKARNIRVTQGKHVIPVPTFEIKKDFSGYLLDPLQIFKSKGMGENPYISEKSMIRPTFSYLGKFTISDSVFRQIAENVANRMPEIYSVTRTRVENYGDGISIYMEAVLNYGNNIIKTLKTFREKTKKEIEKQTAMNVVKIDLVAKGIHFNSLKS